MLMFSFRQWWVPFVTMAMSAAALQFEGATVSGAGDGNPKAGGSDPPGVPLELRLVATKSTYTLDLGGKTEKELEPVFAKEHSNPPLTPAQVELVMEFRNTGTQPIKFWVNGEPSCQLTLDLKGPGAYKVKVFGPPIGANIPPIPPKEIDLDPGKTYTLPLKNLAALDRYRAGFVWYWTKPGEYTLAVRYLTAVSPAPPGAKDAVWSGPPMVGVNPKEKSKGFGQVTLTSMPVKLKIVEK
jgi:hypothetical protein